MLIDKSDEKDLPGDRGPLGYCQMVGAGYDRDQIHHGRTITFRSILAYFIP